MEILLSIPFLYHSPIKRHQSTLQKWLITDLRQGEPKQSLAQQFSTCASQPLSQGSLRPSRNTGVNIMITHDARKWENAQEVARGYDNQI